MSDIQTVTNQTPIEIALGIDENGMTTVSKLYNFLQMSKAHYARWYKTNITDNQFAEENVDYFPFTTNGECGGQASSDSKITASFAKKLSMQQKNKRGEEARDYFVKVEDKSKDLVLALQQASSDPMKMLEVHYAALKQVDKKVDAVDGKVGQLESRITDLEGTMTLDHGQQYYLEKTVNKTVISALGGKESNAYKEIGRKVFAECNGDLKAYFKVNARGNVPKKRYEEAVTYAEKWKPCMNTQMLIEQYNAQQRLDVQGGV